MYLLTLIDKGTQDFDHLPFVNMYFLFLLNKGWIILKYLIFLNFLNSAIFQEGRLFKLLPSGLPFTIVFQSLTLD